MNRIKAVTESILPGLISLRRTLHAYPELAYQEYETARLLRERLGRLEGVSIEAGVAGTGIVATIGGDRPGPCVALRADMDALPIEEETGKLYSSKKDGIMHACGHDGHMACLFGVAQVVSEHRQQLVGPVKLIFQPAEENGAGASRMVQQGALRAPDVDAIFALHGWPELTVGAIALSPGAIMAGDDEFCITIQGTGAHAAQPHRGVDPILIASHIVVALQSIVSRSISPTESLVVTIGKIQSGTTSNIIPAVARITGTIRSLDAMVRQQAIGKLEKIAAGIAESFGAKSVLEWTEGYPAVRNDPQATDYISEIAGGLAVVDEIREDIFPVMAAEDFSFYQSVVPGAFFALGLCPKGQSNIPGLHHPQFDFNDDAIEIGVQLLSEAALNFATSWQRSSNMFSLRSPRPVVSLVRN